MLKELNFVMNYVFTLETWYSFLGTGEWVLLVSGSSARQAHKSETSPVDLCVIGIVDEVVSGGQVIFHK